MLSRLNSIYNFSIMMKDALAYPDKDWDWYLLSQNPNITLKDVLAHNSSSKTRNLYWLSQNSNITMEDVLAHPDKLWSWYGLSQNPNITMKGVLTKSDKPWNWYELSMNPSITMAFVLAHLDKPWSWYWLSANPMTHDKNEFYRERIHKFLEPHFNDDLAWLVSLY